MAAVNLSGEQGSVRGQAAQADREGGMVDDKEHLRDLPAGMHADQKQHENALKAALSCRKGILSPAAMSGDIRGVLQDGRRNNLHFLAVLYN